MYIRGKAKQISFIYWEQVTASCISRWSKIQNRTRPHFHNRRCIFHIFPLNSPSQLSSVSCYLIRWHHEQYIKYFDRDGTLAESHKSKPDQRPQRESCQRREETARRGTGSCSPRWSSASLSAGVTSEATCTEPAHTGNHTPSPCGGWTPAGVTSEWLYKLPPHAEYYNNVNDFCWQFHILVFVTTVNNKQD